MQEKYNNLLKKVNLIIKKPKKQRDCSPEDSLPKRIKRVG